jgi:preprotein translocase subunit SecB
MSLEIIVIKIKESLNFVIKIKLQGIFEIFEQVDIFRSLLSINCPKQGYIG